MYPFHPKRKTVILQWAFKLNSAWAALEMWHLKGHTLKVHIIITPISMILCDGFTVVIKIQI
jgi:hypothetical protein